MTAPFEHLRRLFERARELPAAARTAFLDSKCGRDPELRRRLHQMLAAADGELAPAEVTRATSVVPSSSAPAPTATPAADELQEAPGRRIGPYKLLERLGEGGFGVVFLAEQEQPVVRRVALKIVKLGMDTKQLIARFEQERQALALMDHPNIARVLDAGATATGRPYFVMDLVQGEPIVDFCDRHRLPIRERLALFAQVCNAVQHAHGKGILHRDLKPSNILVTTADDRPVAKVIDFGIAKAIAQPHGERTLLTEERQVIGTLQYMSPEQAEGSPDIDTRSDVYSLGVVLYELLTGGPPFGGDATGHVALSDLHRQVREAEPQKPSTRLVATRDLVALAAHRRTEPRRLAAQVRGELDWIVMKALEKERARRYETANGLAMDVHRFLAGEPVLAAPPSTGYRLRKLVARHRGAFAAAAAIVLALLLGVIGFAWQADVAADERDQAITARAAEAKQRELAEESQASADAINRFLLGMLGAASVRDLGRDVTVAEALDRAAEGVDTAFADQPAVEAAVRQILGRTYLSLGLPDRAAPHVDAGLRLARQVHGEQSTEYAGSLRDQAAIRLARGEHEAAAADYARAVAILAEVRGAESKDALVAQVDHGNQLAALGRHAEAEPLLRSALAARTRLYGREERQALVAINSLAVLLHHTQRFDEAEALYREAVATGERVLGADHPDTVVARMNLASVLRSRRDFAAAEPLMVDALADHRRVFGDDHPKTAQAAAVLGRLYVDRGRFRDALPLFEQSATIRRRIEGERSVGAAEAREELATVLLRLGEVPRAIEEQRAAVAAWQELRGGDAAATLSARLALANALARSEHPAEAEPIFRELLAVLPRVLGEDHRKTIIATNSYGVWLLGQARWTDAEPWLRKALAAARRTEGEDGETAITTQHNLVAVLRETGQLDEAKPLAEDTIQRFQRVFGARHANLGLAHGALALILEKRGEREAARAEFATAIAVSKQALGEDNPAFCSDATALGRLLVEDGDAAAAEPILRDAEAVALAGRGAAHLRTALARLELGRCLVALSRHADAETFLVAAEATLAKTRPDGHADRHRAAASLAELFEGWHAVAPDPRRAEEAAAWRARAGAPR